MNSLGTLDENELSLYGIESISFKDEHMLSGSLEKYNFQNGDECQFFMTDEVYFQYQFRQYFQ